MVDRAAGRARRRGRDHPLLSAGVAMFRAHQSEADIAADAMLSSPSVPVSSAIRPAYQDEREARLRFLFGR
jgi:hypothetical protein